MISEKIKAEMQTQKYYQKDMVEAVNKKGKDRKIQVTQAQLSNFLSKKRWLNIDVVELILDELGLKLVKIL